MIPKETIKLREFFGLYSEELCGLNSDLQEAYAKFLTTPNATNQNYLDKSVRKTLKLFHAMATELGYVKKEK